MNKHGRGQSEEYTPGGYLSPWYGSGNRIGRDGTWRGVASGAYGCHTLGHGVATGLNFKLARFTYVPCISDQPLRHVLGWEVYYDAEWRMMQVGCRMHTLDHWRDHWESIAGDLADLISREEVDAVLERAERLSEGT